MVAAAFAPLIGQEQAKELLTQAMECNRIAPAYLFAGPPGVGRSLAARCFVELLLSPSGGGDAQFRASTGTPPVAPDLLWIEPTYLHQGKRLTAAEAEAQGLKRRSPPQIRLEQVREIGQFLSRPPLKADRAVVVLDQAETMAEGAANGLLKTLEEPGRGTLILIAPTVEALLPTLISRCQRIPFYRLSSDAMAQVLQQMGQGAILASSEVLALAEGSPGAAIVHWQQLQAISPDLLAALEQPPSSLKVALELARQISTTLDTEAQLWFVDYLQQRYWRSAQVSTMPLLILQTLEKTRQQLLSYAQPRLVWEVTLLTLQEQGQGDRAVGQ
ncbi:MAG: DNA polymerase III subunit delta' [Leptolyngbyaceae cyanobacterium bins.59]|nr:DNA polymerase III subunit delta' [Leptolyngbyaceae cyanobacterium bins.59]